MLPIRCSVRENGKDCFNPPEFVISVLEGKQEYMVGVTCQKHREKVSAKLKNLQAGGKIPNGKIKFCNGKTKSPQRKIKSPKSKIK